MTRHTLSYISLALLLLMVQIMACSEKTTSGPDTTETFTISVKVTDEVGRVLPGLAVTTSPVTREVFTDSTGRAVFEEIPVERVYSFIVKRSGMPNTAKSYDFSVLEPPYEVVFTITSESPVILIIYPLDNTLLSPSGLSFLAKISDREDGALPDSAIVWRSDLDGEIGRGESPDIELLSPGLHTISVTATDSDGKVNSGEVKVAVINFDSDSYFPLPVTGRWTYKHETATIPNPDSRFPWELGSVEATIDSTNRRVSHMTYRLAGSSGGNTRKYDFTVVDYYQIVGNTVQVVKTTEDLEIWLGNNLGNPDLTLRMVTEYSQPMILFNDVYDLSSGGDYSTIITVSVRWDYTDKGGYKRTFRESFDVNIDYSIGDQEILIVGGHEVDAIPVIIIQDTSTRTWWLARGLGIVRFEHNTFGVTSNALLNSSNLAQIFSFGKNAAKKAAGGGIFSIINPVATRTIDTPEGPEDLIEEIRRLRTFMP